MRTGFLLTLAFFLFGAAGCKPAPSIVGGWDVEGKPSTMTLNADGTFTFENLLASGLKSFTSGTYKLDGNMLTMTTTKAMLSSSDPAKQKQIDLFNNHKAADFGNSQVFNVTWGSDKQVLLTTSSPDPKKISGMTLDRK